EAFTSLDAQRDAALAYIHSQQHAGWCGVTERYDDGGFTGGNLDRPALKRLLTDIQAQKLDCLVVHKVDRLSPSLLAFPRLMEVLDGHQVAFVWVTQQFNTATSMGRLVLHILYISEDLLSSTSDAREETSFTTGSTCRRRSAASASP